MGAWDHLIFDMDGVLVDSSPCHAEAFARLWQHCGLPGPAYEHIAGRPTREVVCEYTAALRPSARQVDEWVSFKQRHARSLISTRTIVFADTVPALQALTANCRRLVLATSASGETMRLILATSGLAPYFPVAVSADEVPRGKPAPDVYACVVARIAAAADRCLVVEDSDAGIRAGLAAGIDVACVRTGHTVDHPRFVSAFPDLLALADYLGACET